MAETAAPPAHNGVAASRSPRAPSASIDPVTHEIIQGKLLSVVDEMAIVMTKTSMSPVIYEVLDFACGICNAKGELIAQTNGITLFTGTFGAQIRSVIDRFGASIFPSDVIVTNDPFRGGTHACDFAIVRPVFAESRLIAFAINVAHWLDVGGAIPGSLPPDATSIFQEGLQLPYPAIAPSPVWDFMNAYKEYITERELFLGRKPDFGALLKAIVEANDAITADEQDPIDSVNKMGAAAKTILDSAAGIRTAAESMLSNCITHF